MIARLVITLLGLACASAAAVIFLPIAVILDPLVQHAAQAGPAESWFDFLAGVIARDDPDVALTALFQLLWTIGLLVCFMPVALTALLGAVTRARSFAFYAGLAGVLAGAVPWVLRAGRLADRGAQMSAAEAHVTLILFLTGAVAGSVYWLIAARDAHRPPGRGWMADQARG